MKSPYSQVKLSCFAALFSLLVVVLVVPSVGISSEPGQSKMHYLINSTNPHYDIALFVYDGEKKYWPNYCVGKPNDGGHWGTSDSKHPEKNGPRPQGPFEGFFEIHFTRLAQSQGDQSRRVLGESIVDGQTDLNIKLLSLGETRVIDIRHNDDFSPVQQSKKTPDGVKRYERTHAKLELTLRGVTTTVDAELRIKRAGKTSIQIEAFFTTTGKELGLTKVSGPINMRLYLQARLPQQSKKRK